MALALDFVEQSRAAATKMTSSDAARILDWQLASAMSSCELRRMSTGVTCQPESAKAVARGALGPDMRSNIAG